MSENKEAKEIVKTTVRIIPRLDVKGPNLIKGMSFDGWRVLGTPEFFARKYNEAGADELIYQDSAASLFQREPMLDVISRTARETSVPLTVVGGIRRVEDIRKILKAGADKVAINTAAIRNPELVRDARRVFGAQCIALSIEAQRDRCGNYECFVDYGRQRTGVFALEWAQRAVELGAGEILLTSIDREGTGEGFDLELTKLIADAVPVPVIACGGAGKAKDFSEAINVGHADAVSAASVFHYNYAEQVDSMWMQLNEPRLRSGENLDSGNIDFLNFGYGGLRDVPVEPISIPEVKNYLAEEGIPIRRDKNAPEYLAAE